MSDERTEYRKGYNAGYHAGSTERGARKAATSGRPDAKPTMHIIRRTDGEEMGEFAFFATDGPDCWDVAEYTDHDDDTVYEILACYPVARRKFLSSTLCPFCEGEGDMGMMCPSCGGSGEHEPPEAERLTAAAVDEGL